jgi:hypothetical protein
MTTAEPLPFEQEHERLRHLTDLEDALEAAWAGDAKALINWIKYFDPVTGEWVRFLMYPPEGWEPPASLFKPSFEGGAKDWFWQSLIIEWLQDPENKKFLVYKARQLGITLLACAYALYLMLFEPGSVCVAYSYEEGEAKKLIQAAWAMYQSLPAIFKEHVKVVTPKAAEIPSEYIRLRHADGRISEMQALPATKKHGHGGRVRFAIMDEVARMDYGREIYTAINPATSRGGKLLMISTANGVSNKETGEGNFFHHLYVTKVEKNLEYWFLPWNLEPTRDADWYEREAMALDEVERNQQYPLNENDGFMLSGAIYFNREALDFYAANTCKAIQRGQFVSTGRRRAAFRNIRDGIIEIYELPHPDGKYAIAVDTATGSGADYTSAHVIDLSSGAIVAKMRAKIEAGRAGFQLHYLGKFYNTAKICPERQGGSGEAVITVLKDGTDMLPPYPNIYRHKKFTKGSKDISQEYGHPMGEGARQTVLDGLKLALRRQEFPWLPAGTVDELGTFVYKDTRPSPRAEDGCNDDDVMSLALAREMFRQFGQRPEKRKKWRKSKYQPSPVRSTT